MVEHYLVQRAELKGVVVIMDIRRQPSEGDLQLLEWLAHHNISAITVLTKTDKLSRLQQKHQFAMIRRALPPGGAEPVIFSAMTGEGKKELWRKILSLMGS